MDKLKVILEQVCEADISNYDMDAPLHTSPGWDSMRAVNFQLELEAAYSMDLSEAGIDGSKSLTEVAEILSRNG